MYLAYRAERVRVWGNQELRVCGTNPTIILESENYIAVPWSTTVGIPLAAACHNQL